jgi:hypothetical protein
VLLPVKRIPWTDSDNALILEEVARSKRESSPVQFKMLSIALSRPEPTVVSHLYNNILGRYIQSTKKRRVDAKDAAITAIDPEEVPIKKKKRLKLDLGMHILMAVRTEVWTEADDTAILRHVHTAPSTNWRHISLVLKRSVRAVREHYFRDLSDGVYDKLTMWTKVEDAQLLKHAREAYVTADTPSWTALSLVMRRSPLALEGRYLKLVKDPGTDHHDFYNDAVSLPLSDSSRSLHTINTQGSLDTLETVDSYGSFELLDDNLAAEDMFDTIIDDFQSTISSCLTEQILDIRDNDELDFIDIENVEEEEDDDFAFKQLLRNFF